MYCRLGHHFGRTQWNSYVTRVNLTFCLETVFVFVPNVPMAQKSFWTHPMVLLDDEVELKAYFGSFGDSVYLDAR
jgi:hypothetical protein